MFIPIRLRSAIVLLLLAMVSFARPVTGDVPEWQLDRLEAPMGMDSIDIYTESFGDSTRPAVLLIMGASASMIWWDDDFCQRLADEGRFVIRYDNRDVGQSTCYPPGEPGYDVEDMADDAVGVLDSYGVEKAHLVGMSLGGMIAQLVALRNPDRVLSMTLIASSVWDNRPDLPPISDKILQYHASAGSVDWSNQKAAARYMAGGWRLLGGSKHPFDENRALQLAEAEAKRARNLLSMFNHALLKGGESWYGKAGKIAVPTLVIHGTEDPVLPYPHAKALVESIPGAKLLTLEGAGHEIHPATWPAIIEAIATHSGK